MKLPGHVVLPALTNAHDHLQLNGIPSLPVTRHFPNSYDWARAFAGHFEDPDVQRARAVPLEIRHWQGALKNALCGTTTVMHHDPPAAIFQQRGFPVRVVQPFGWAHSLHAAYGPPVEASHHETPAGAGWFIHLAEGIDELATRELKELRRRGCLDARTVVIHGVALSDADIEDIIACGAAVVWCPSSNLRILGRTLSIRALRRLYDAQCLALGTDSRLSGARDLLEELQFARRYSDFAARELLELATARGARVLRCQSDNVDRGDYIVIRTGGGDPAECLLRLARHQLRAVVRNGRPWLTDPDLDHWFTEHNVRYEPVLLDGQPKLCASDALTPLRGSWRALEPGLTLAAIP
ncbi:MAG TPA: amidohydrolase family protein [Steroidobacteraceae bacterium]|nr:amidohydrolase family protein [Steroidobacteraceae bacterium]